ncbi:MAG: ribonuclease HII [candidate division KSB1 bacterium]|jgi:ribonuclease HII|nr:ribonuclease HII [candidate division KSB1 bacterium]
MDSLLTWEKRLWSQGITLFAGIDEAGRGPIAGPVVAAAVIFPKETYIPGVKDSKILSPAARAKLYPIIKQHALAHSIGVVDECEIDELNILQATYRAMKKAVKSLRVSPQHILVDGNRAIPGLHIDQTTIVGGDNRSFTIAAASILAKVTRDAMMVKFHEQYPVYGFEKHKGYPTRQHIEAIRIHGFCPIHRRSFHVRALEEFPVTDS